MATAFSAFDTTPTNAVADIKAKILLSSDWSNPTGDRVTCTTTRGAGMVVNLSGAAATAMRLQFTVYRNTSLDDPLTRYLVWRTSGGATSDPLHCMVSAGKEHLYISVEGPRGGEPNEFVAATGSGRQAFFLGDIVPYHASDTTPAVVLVANSSTSNFTDLNVVVSRNAGNSASWVTASLATLHSPGATASGGSSITWVQTGLQRASAADAKTYMFPYVVFEATDGLRGRINKAFHCGYNYVGSGTGTTDLLPAVYSRVTYGGETYLLVTPDRSLTTSGAQNSSPFGRHNDATGCSVVIAVPHS